MSIQIDDGGDLVGYQLENLGRRYHELQDQLANAVASLETVCESPCTNARQLYQCQQRVEYVKRRLTALWEEVDHLEEQDFLF